MCIATDLGLIWPDARGNLLVWYCTILLRGLQSGEGEKFGEDREFFIV